MRHELTIVSTEHGGSKDGVQTQEQAEFNCQYLVINL